MQVFGCFGADSDPLINCALHSSFATSAIVLTLMDYVIALVLVLVFPRLLAKQGAKQGSLVLTRCGPPRFRRPHMCVTTRRCLLTPRPHKPASTLQLKSRSHGQTSGAAGA